MDPLFEKNLITTKDAGELFGYSSDYLARLARSGKIEGKRIGHSWFVERESLSHFLDQQGIHKVDYARALSRQREIEYKKHHSFIRNTGKALSKPVSLPALNIKENALVSQFVALSVSFFVVASGAYVAYAAPFAQFATEAQAIANETVFGFNGAFGDIPLRIASRINDAKTKMSVVSPRAAVVDTSTSMDLASVVLTESDLSSLQMVLADTQYVQTASPFGNKTPAVPIRSPETLARTVESVQTIAFATYGIITRPSLIADSFIHAYIAIGEGIITVTHSAIRADVATAYGLSETIPATGRVAFSSVVSIGDTLARATAHAPLLATALFLRTTEMPAIIAPVFAQTVFDAEYVGASHFVAFVHGGTERYALALRALGTAGYESASNTRSFAFAANSFLTNAPSIFEDTYLGMLGKSALALHNFSDTEFSSLFRVPEIATTLAATAPTLSIAERLVLGIYTTINNFFSSATHTLALLFSPIFAPSSPAVTPVVIQKIVVATSTPSSTPYNRYTTNYSYPTYTTIVQGVSEDFLNQSLTSLRLQLRGSTENASNNISGSILALFDKDIVITNGTSITATTGDFTNLTGGTTNLGDTTITGNLAVSGIITPSLISATSYISAPYFTATSTTATSTFAGSLAVGTSTPFGNNLFIVGTSTPLLSISGITGRIGIGTSSPASIFDIFGTDALHLPVGTSAERPIMALAGQVRYNTTTHQFEGYGDNAVWQGLGGVINPAQTTYITAGTDDYLRFVTASAERMTITSTGLLGIGTTSPFASLSIAGLAGGTSNLFAISTSTSLFSTTTTLTINGNGDLSLLNGANLTISGTATLTNAPVLSSLTAAAGTFLAADTAGRMIATTSPQAALGFTPISNVLAKGSFIVGDDAGVAQATSTIFISSLGDVGIGTTTPTTGKLVVNGNLALENQGQLKFYPLDASYPYYASLSASSTMAANVNWTLPQADGTTGQVLATNGVGNMYWTTMNSSGNVSTSTSETAGYFPMWTSTNGTPALLSGTSALFQSGSNVGIGTSTPNWLLQVSGTQPSFALSDYSAGNDLKHWLFSSMGGNLYIGTSTDAFATSTISALTILNNGNVGIGTSSPTTYKFSVNGSASLGSGDEVMRVSSTGNVGIGTTSPYAKLSLVDNTASLRDVFAISSTTSGLIFKVDSYGRTFADGAYTGTGADYAEYFYTDSVDLQSGEIVCVDIVKNSAVKRCARGADNNVMGIVSTKPSVIGNATKAVEENPSHYAVIGMMGQVEAFVSTENGPINIGDSLTSASTTPGYAMRADNGDSTVAVALESFATSTGKIKVLISRRNKSLAVEQVESLVVERIANMKIEDSVQQLVKEAIDTIALSKLTISGNVSAAAYETIVASSTGFMMGTTTVTAEIPSAVLTADGEGVDIYKLATYTLSGVQTLIAKIDAHELRLASLEDRVMALEDGTISSESSAFSTTSLASAFQGLGVFIQRGFAQFGTLVADQFVVATNSAGSSSAGAVTILAGNTVAQVTNVYVKPSSKIFVTLTASTTGSWYISDKQNGSFKLVLENAQPADVTFDYFLVQTEGQMATSTSSINLEASLPSQDQTLNDLEVSPPSDGTDTTASENSFATSTLPLTPSSGDTTPPVVTLSGEAAIQITVGDAFTDPGATATDDTDGSLTPAVTGLVDTTTAGLYTLTYTATDAAGNVGSVSRVVTVVAASVESAPPIEEPVVEPIADIPPVV